MIHLMAVTDLNQEQVYFIYKASRVLSFQPQYYLLKWKEILLWQQT